VLSFIKTGNINKAKETLEENILKNKVPKIEALFFLNYVKLFSDYSEHEHLIDLLEFKDYFKYELNHKTEDWLNIPENSLLIHERRGFYDTEKMLLLDEMFLLDKMDAIFEKEYHNEIEEFDTGFVLYPYIIDKYAVTEETYMKFCEDTNKNYEPKSFNINNAIEYAKAKGDTEDEWKVATEEEWINAFRNFNYNVSIPQPFHLFLK
jgi:hypothetical protein